MTPITISTRDGAAAATVQISSDEISLLEIALEGYLPTLQSARYAGVTGGVVVAADELALIAERLVVALKRLSDDLLED